MFNKKKFKIKKNQGRRSSVFKDCGLKVYFRVFNDVYFKRCFFRGKLFIGYLYKLSLCSFNICKLNIFFLDKKNKEYAKSIKYVNLFNVGGLMGLKHI